MGTKRRTEPEAERWSPWGEYLTYDFDVAVGPDGAHYILTDTWANVIENQATGHSVPVWDIYVQKLAPNLTSTVGSNSTSKLIRSAKDLHKQGLNLEACGFFYHDAYWYHKYSYPAKTPPATYTTSTPTTLWGHTRIVAISVLTGAVARTKVPTFCLRQRVR
ncbi:n-sulfoglucosamine sulfohydrolase [Fusarium mexicanum]|uniref:N-sulfoglucosamine sulfohydrolase n=1 Tax=Fusarium mexicanum TaxID=751941 RepID=A0A8H5I3D5_9HYPO|nr:n-sulfoglucosamine sulfohydrolase [Fusarium mexicanum]